MEELTGFPQVFGRYLLLRRLSRGGMGEVYLAKSGQVSGFEKIVVIKRILPHLSSDKNFSRRFIQEANIAIKLSHNNIVPVLEVGKVAGEFFLALEYVEGRDLRTLQSACYKKGKLLPPYLALLIVRDLLTGLSYAHRRVDENELALNIVHCDISPPNVLVSYNGEIKIIDFGIAKTIQMQDDEENSQMGFGKFGYMAPEQVLKGEDLDNRTDLYSAGVVLWELLTGDKMIVFNETTPYKDIAKKVVIEKPQKPSAINPAIGRDIDLLVMKALEKKPENRFQSASAFRDAVQMALVKLAPTVTNDTLGEYILELFSDRITEERQMIREAKQVNMAEYKMELTTAMEETVSFAVDNDWRSLTGPIGNQPLPPPPPSQTGSVQNPQLGNQNISNISNPTPSFSPELSKNEAIPTPQYLKGSVINSKKGILFGALGVLGIITLISIYFIVNSTSKTKKATQGYNILSKADFKIDPKLLEPVSVMKAVKIVLPVKHPMKTPHSTMKPIKRVMRISTYHKRQMAKVMTPMAMIPAMKAVDNNAKLKAQVKRRFQRTLSRYNRFKSSHGEILAGKWKKVTNYLYYGNKSDPNYYQKLNDKLSYINSLISKYSK